MSRRVVVTGLGAVTPIGNNVDDFWTSVKAGKIGFDHITKFDTTDYKCHIAAEIADLISKRKIHTWLDVPSVQVSEVFRLWSARHKSFMKRAQTE